MLSSGLQLPGPPYAAGAYRVATVGLTMAIEGARQSARDVGLSMLAVLHEVVRVVKVAGMVNAVPDFKGYLALSTDARRSWSRRWEAGADMRVPPVAPALCF